jgi:hypothetical protein
MNWQCNNVVAQVENLATCVTRHRVRVRAIVREIMRKIVTPKKDMCHFVVGVVCQCFLLSKTQAAAKTD